MEFSLNAAMNASAEIADSINYPNLRLSTVATVPGAKTPMHDVPSITNYTDPKSGKVVSWRVSEPDAFAPATSTEFSYFSAVCYLFGRDLFKMKGGKVPIGLVASDVGGVKIETLMSADALLDESCGGTAYAPAGAAAPESSLVAGLDGSVWNGMINPLLPMRFAGVVFCAPATCMRMRPAFAAMFTSVREPDLLARTCLPQIKASRTLSPAAPRPTPACSRHS